MKERASKKKFFKVLTYLDTLRALNPYEVRARGPEQKERLKNRWEIYGDLYRLLGGCRTLGPVWFSPFTQVPGDRGVIEVPKK
jgi:hypothetical protein